MYRGGKCELRKRKHDVAALVHRYMRNGFDARRASNAAAACVMRRLWLRTKAGRRWWRNYLAEIYRLAMEAEHEAAR